ncbi:acetolactate synthase large subunit [Vibrio sp. SCSIO 43140]|uniref:acetolactate synthase large subunit n=1 Tax=Vibrio sp. SCSIO 43140 TaxID=2819100 RepID=UPI002074FCE2|nr:acetolactate synthase large subunit [Vibrio sp. SCSIO 43140]USD62593.1 acetolactate synthase large subunit [Vibrio sp. SCSIO 43140]
MSESKMNGAQGLFKVLSDAGLDTCFANPGTSEMQLVYEVGKSENVRPILCLQENTVTGAADGYARMTGKPAFTMLHVGGGFANSIANLHNAGRANTPMVNIVGANAAYHQHNFPEHEMIGGKITDLARVVSHWTHEARSADDLVRSGIEAVTVAKSKNGKISTLVAPTNFHWEEISGVPSVQTEAETLKVSENTINDIVARLNRGSKTAIILGGTIALSHRGLELAAKVASKTGAQLMSETMAARMAQGEGTVTIPQVPYLVDLALDFFKGYEQVILIGALKPVATFGYFKMPTLKIPSDCEVIDFASHEHDILDALDQLVTELDAQQQPIELQQRVEPTLPTGDITAQSVGQTLNLLMKQNSILVDESNTMGATILPELDGAASHDYLYASNGAAIGGGIPVALGASIACPNRKTVLLQADGSAMYTNQGLWSIARENCDVTILILKNDEYAILNVELARVRDDEANEKMLSMLKLDDPSIDWVQMGQSQGISSVSVHTNEALHDELSKAIAHKGPRLIEVNVKQNTQPFIDAVKEHSQKLRAE